MLAECPYCEAKVDGKVLASNHEQGEMLNELVSFLRCPSCRQSFTVVQEEVGIDPQDGESIYDAATRVWPEPKRTIHWSLPEAVKISLIEADKSFRAAAYMASAVMCGRALEAVCRHHKTKSQYLGGGLEELLEREIIDKRLFQWSQLLQRQRNIAAHASDEKISKQDAEDLIDFVLAISDYIFVLTDKFDKFTARQEKAKSKAAGKEKTG